MYIHTLTAVASKCQPTHQEQFGIHHLAQGQFDMQTSGIIPATFQQQDAGSIPKPQHITTMLRVENFYDTIHPVKRHWTITMILKLLF